ncbi:MAG TPA: hypothetical protein DDW90_08075 [Cyanobacteria bacterium UBA9971]|nr:hypothetical protein [Cyanobacteria bacterium UBA9971]
MKCNVEKNIKDCTCSYSCSKRGICCECVAYHRSKKELPGCFFPSHAEKTWDRSIDNFINSWKK